MVMRQVCSVCRLALHVYTCRATFITHGAKTLQLSLFEPLTYKTQEH